jgi:dTDP-4-dehydrorhamnose reductase
VTVAPPRLARPVLLFGGTGQVGRELRAALASLGEVITPSRAEANLEQPDALRDVIRRVQPSVVVNAAALTNVDRSEREPDLAFTLNDAAPGAMASASRETRALFVHYSTDYVFDGARDRPYTEDDQPNPINVYGLSKLAGERSVAASGGSFLVLRTSWVYSRTGTGFVPTLLRQLREPGDVRVVADQTGSPTWSRALAAATADILRGLVKKDGIVLPDEARGVYHLGGRGAASREEIANEVIAALAEVEPVSDKSRHRLVIPISASEFGAAAARPRYSALSIARVERAFGVSLDPWQADLRRMLLTS